MSKKPSGPTDYRDSGTGRFVPPGYAERHPKTTEGEHNRPKPSGGGGKKK